MGINATERYTQQDVMNNADFKYTFGNYKFDRQFQDALSIICKGLSWIPQIGEYLSVFINICLEQKQIESISPKAVQAFNIMKKNSQKLKDITDKGQLLNYMDIIINQYELIQKDFINFQVRIQKSSLGMKQYGYYDHRRFQLKFSYMLQHLIILKARKNLMNDEFNKKELQTKYKEYSKILSTLIEDICVWRTTSYKGGDPANGCISYFADNWADQRVQYRPFGFGSEDRVKYSVQLKQQAKKRLNQKYNFNFIHL